MDAKDIKFVYALDFVYAMQLINELTNEGHHVRGMWTDRGMFPDERDQIAISYTL